MIENQISYKIRGAIFKVYNALGPGLLESAYEAVLAYELKKIGLNVKQQIPIPIIYYGITIEVGYRIDLLVEDKVLVELKSVESFSPIHHKQVITYLKLMDLKLGLLVNFNCENMEEGIIRKINRKYIHEF